MEEYKTVPPNNNWGLKNSRKLFYDNGLQRETVLMDGMQLYMLLDRIVYISTLRQ